MSKLFDNYSLRARLLPAILASVPSLVIYYYLRAFLGGIADILYLQFLGYISLEAAVLYLIIQLNNRLVGKLLQRRIFENGRTLPTTLVLLPSDPSFSTQTKRDIAAKFKKDFGLVLPIFDNNMLESEKRQRIQELTSYVRNATRKDTIVFNHNVEYGFVRNLCGGAFVASISSAVGVTLFGIATWNTNAFWICSILFVSFTILFFCSKPLIRYFGGQYARVLFEQYLSIKVRR